MSGAYLIGAVIADLTARFPDARVSVTNAPYNILLNSLRTGAIDIIFGVLRRPDWGRGHPGGSALLRSLLHRRPVGTPAGVPFRES